MRFYFSCLAWLFPFALIGQSAFAEEGSSWQTDLDVARHQAAQSNRLVLVHFWAPWCAPCAGLEKNVFQQPGFDQALAANYVPVKINFDIRPDIARQYGIKELPTDVILAPDGRLLDKARSPLTTEAFLGRVNQVAQRFRPPMNPAQPGTVGPRYAERFGGQPPMQPTQAPPPGAAPWQGPPAGPHAASAGPAVSGYGGAPQAAPAQMGATGQQFAPPNAQAMAAAQVAPGSFAPRPQMPAAAPSAPVNPPLGLDGNCPVELCEHHRWVPGNRQFGRVYRGRVYLFAGEEQLNKFLQNPDRYSPVASGNDPVLALEGHAVPGQRAHGVFFDDRVYLFASEQSLERFKQNPDHYAAEILQARR